MKGKKSMLMWSIAGMFSLISLLATSFSYGAEESVENKTCTLTQNLDEKELYGQIWETDCHCSNCPTYMRCWEDDEYYDIYYCSDYCSSDSDCITGCCSYNMCAPFDFCY